MNTLVISITILFDGPMLLLSCTLYVLYVYSRTAGAVYMSPVSPVFLTVESVRLFLNSKRIKASNSEIKMSMLERRTFVVSLYLIIIRHEIGILTG